MSEQYVWLQKDDTAYKEYKEKGWHTVLSVRTFTNNVYYCYSRNNHFVNEEQRNKLLAPICIINKQYNDCMILFEDKCEYGFIWKGKRCFQLDIKIINELIESKMNFSENNKIIKIKSANQLVIDTEIQVRSSTSLYYVLSASIFIVLTFSIGAYLWLF